MSWLDKLVDEAKYTHDINYAGPAYVHAEQAAKQLESEGKTEEAKEIRAAMLDNTVNVAMTAGLAKGVLGAGKALLRKQLMPTIRLIGGMAGGIGGMYAGDKLVHALSDGKYDTWGDMVQDKTKGIVTPTLAYLSNPLAILGGFAGAGGAGKAYAGTKRGKIDMLSGMLDGLIDNTKLNPSFIDQAAFLGRFGWAPKQTIPYRHGSKQADLKTFVPKHDRWDVVTHDADPYMYFVTDQSTPVSAANMMDRRAYQYTGNIIAEKPIVQIGEIKPAGVKNNSRNQLVARARQQGADTYIMQDIEDNQVPHQNIVARFIGSEGEAVQGGALLQTKTTPTKTSLAFFERKPAKISEAERLGIPKGIKYYTQEENLAFRNQINNFAKKYGYEPIGDEVTDPEVLERYARSLIKRHNTFYRGVGLNPQESNLSLEYMATHAPGGGAGELYITPYQSVAAMYGEPVEILRLYKLGADRTRWFNEGDFQIYTAGGRRDMHLWEGKKGIAAPWLTSETFEGKSDWIYKPRVETELTGRNQQFIPISVQYRNIHPHLQPLDRVGSLAVPTTAFYKSGGSIHIKKKNRGKFTASAKAAGEGVQEHAHKVMNDPNATPLQKKRANFAIQAKKWHRKHQLGGKINYLDIFE